MTAPSPLSGPSPKTLQEQGIEARLLKISYGRLRLNLLLSGASFAVGTVILWPYLPHRELVIWCASIFLMLAVGLTIDAAYRRAYSKVGRLRFWKYAFTANVWQAGATWGLGPVLMFANADPGQAMLLVIMVLASCAVVINSVAEQRLAMFGFISLSLLPPAATAWLQGDGILNASAIVLVLGHAAFLLTGANAHQTLRVMIESQARLQAVLDNSLDAIIGIDAEGRVTDWNRRAETMFGWPRGEALGLPIDTNLIPERFRDYHRQGMARFFAGSDKGISRRRLELSALRRDGSEFAAELVIVPQRSGDTWSFTCFITDISERKAAEESLLVLSRAVEQSPASIIITDPRGEIQYVNPKFEAVTGYSRDEVRGRNPNLLSSGDKSAADYRRMWDMLVSGKTWQGEFHNRRKDGSLFWELASISPVVNDKGVLTHYVAVKEDISERKATELELVTARETAERASRAKSDFLSSMSHELRTPMNAILGFAQVLEMDERLFPDQREFVEEILKGGTHLLELINDVLELSRIESGKIGLSVEPLDAGELVEECRMLIQPLADARKLRMALSIAPDLCLRGDRMRLKQSLLNLLSNAVKYNRDGGRIDVEACAVGRGRVRIVVSDSGPGIAPERMHELFQPFSRLGAEQGSIEGTGIGLNITRHLVRLMEGDVGVDSRLGEGSRFWIELPAAEAPPPEPAGSRATAVEALPDGPQASGKLLCIDDNPVNLKLITRMLARLRPLQLQTASSARQGIDLARADPPDLILLDINMPEMDGFQALGLLRSDEKLRNIPVIAITANAMPRDIERGLEAGFAAYLTKPLDHVRLISEVDRMLSTSRIETP